ncbi:ABC transporter permease [Streptomyces sp. 1331.2]|uniref:ABC transporter permease n=1 Tax=Streptomyces sp. 1331.2 TaxID=1938835 RepID=UPI000BC87271|nr:ABC transporter permease [Streptomyces sp. 1331.2]SOB82207.1 putative ABC transport system permease protein [Streptomyces sp. 1331.2]
MKLSAWRVALRIARRDALRAKGRSALVIAMVALPVLGVTGADVVFRSADLSPAEKAVRIMGQAAAELEMVERGSAVLQAPDPSDGLSVENPTDDLKPGDVPRHTPEQQRALDTAPGDLVKQLLPAGAVLVPEREGPNTAASSVMGLLSTRVNEMDLNDPVWQGRVDLVKGRAPANGHEVAVTPAFLKRSGLKIGERTAVRGLEADPFTITGVYEYPGELTASELFAPPGTLIDRLATPPGASRGPATGTDEPVRWLVKLPAGADLDWRKVVELNRYGFSATSRAVLIDPPARADVPFYVKADERSQNQTSYFDRTSVVILATVVGMALLEIVLLAGPAFAVGARRSRRQLGLLAAAGGDRANVRAVVLGGGIVLGVTGAVVGLGLGVSLVALLRTQAEEYSGRRFGHFALQPLDLIGVLVVGLVTGLLAAVVPAVQASRQDVVAALTGRDSLKPPNRKLAVLGLLMLGGGAALALLGATSGIGSRSLAVLGGSVVAELGMVALTPYLVGLFGRLGRWLSLGPRLALRDSVRHRGRTAPAVAAVMAAVAGAVAVGVYTTSVAEQNRREYVAHGPSGSVLLGRGWLSGTDAKLLPQMREAVERSIPDLGPRADVQNVHYKGDCSENSSCGYISVDLPKEIRCPVLDPGREFAPGEAERILSTDTRCQTDNRRGNPYGALTAGDATLLHNLYGVTDPAAGQALAAGKAVVFDPRYLKDGKVAVQFREPADLSTGPADRKQVSHEIAVDAVLADTSVPSPGQAVISPATAAGLGFTTTSVGSVWLPGAAPSDGSQQKADGALARITDRSLLTVERGYRSQADLVTLGLTVFAGLVALGAAGIATGLAAADSQRDLTTLAAVGAEPRIRRSLSGFQCGVIAAMGAVLGVVCGIVPGVALRKVESAGGSYPGISPEELANQAIVVLPWPTIAGAVVVLPVLAAALAAVLTRSRITLLRRSG